MIRKLVVVFSVMGAMSAPANSAEITNVIDALDGNKPFDGIVALSYEHIARRSLILREWICQSSESINSARGTNPLCPSGNQILDTRQLVSTETKNIMNIDVRAGLAPDLEFYVNIPVVLSWDSQLGYDSGVSGANSLVDSPLAPSLFSVPFKSKTRSGLGDTTFGLKVAPFHADRDPLYPSWVIGVEYVAPTAPARVAGTENVGSGVHGLNVFTAISRRVVSWAEPWFELHSNLRFRAGKPFDHEVTTQTLIQPGQTFGFKMGSEFFPWRTPSETGQYVAIDLGFSADFTLEGREFTELFDALGDSDCDPNENCSLTLYTRDGGERGADGTFSTTDGVTDVEQYGVFGANLSVAYQAMQFLKVRVGLSYEYITSHFITFADAGKDLDGEGDVERSNSERKNEYNPKYIENIDDIGQRFRVDDSHRYSVLLSIEGQF